MQGQANEIQYRNIANLWRALGKHGPAPRPPTYDEANALIHSLAKAYTAKHGRGDQSKEGA